MIMMKIYMLEGRGAGSYQLVFDTPGISSSGFAMKWR